MTLASPRAPRPTVAGSRRQFFRRTYTHLAGAIAVFALIESWLLGQPFVPGLVETMTASNWRWLVVLGLWFGVACGARLLAGTSCAPAVAYAGLALFVVAEAVIFAPLLYFAGQLDPEAIPTAALMTALLVGGLTTVARVAPRAFRIPRFVMVGFAILLNVLVVSSLIFHFPLGVFFSVVVVTWAGASILDTTARLTSRYRTDEHVAAAMDLFLNVALMFWYILRILLLQQLNRGRD